MSAVFADIEAENKTVTELEGYVSAKWSHLFTGLYFGIQKMIY